MAESKKSYLKALLALLCLVVIFSGCQSSPPPLIIKKTSDGNLKTIVPLGKYQKVTKYDVNFLAKGTAIVNFTVECGTVYSANKLDASQLQAVLTLLAMPEMKFDTLRKEYTVGVH